MENLKSLLCEKNIKVPDDWLEQCVEHVQEEHGQRLPFNELVQNVYQQWLTADLTDLETPVLPNCLPKANRFVLNGNYSIQMNSIFDASVSAYSQLQKISNTENSNDEVSEEEPKKPWEQQQKAKRMLVMELTDGVTTVRAMEYQPIPHLKVDLAPGIKVQLTGRIECRKGMLMLTSENIKVLDGSVDRLMEPNSQKNLLTSRLSAHGDVNRALTNVPANLGLNQNANPVDPAAFPQLCPNVDHSSTGEMRRNRRDIRDDQRDEMIYDDQTEDEIRQPVIGRTKNVLDDDDDVIFLEDNDEVRDKNEDVINIDDDDLFLKAAEECERQGTVSTCNKPPIPDTPMSPSPSSYNYEPPRKKERSLEEENVFDLNNDDDWFPEGYDDGLIDINTSPSLLAAEMIDDSTSITIPPSGTVIGSVTSKVSNYEVDIIHDPNNGIDVHFRGSRPSNQVKTNWQLIRLCDLAPQSAVHSKLCTVKAAILHTISHLNPNNGEKWSYSAKITDGTAVVDCQISDEVLSELIEMTASEAMAVRNSGLESAKVRAVELVKKAANFVQSFNGLMQIETKFQTLPVVRKMKAIDESDVKSLEKFFLSY